MESVITKEGRPIIVKTGYRIRVTKDGVISKPEMIDPVKMERWWEK